MAEARCLSFGSPFFSCFLPSPQGVVVGIIKDMAAHPKEKNLQIVTVSDGGFGSASVVTNAKNVAVGLKVATRHPPPVPIALGDWIRA